MVFRLFGWIGDICTEYNYIWMEYIRIVYVKANGIIPLVFNGEGDHKAIKDFSVNEIRTYSQLCNKNDKKINFVVETIYT